MGNKFIHKSINSFSEKSTKLEIIMHFKQSFKKNFKCYSFQKLLPRHDAFNNENVVCVQHEWLNRER